MVPGLRADVLAHFSPSPISVPPALRVQFREEALLQRRQEREAQALQRLKEEEERDSRLEALRNQVRLLSVLIPIHFPCWI